MMDQVEIYRHKEESWLQKLWQSLTGRPEEPDSMLPTNSMLASLWAASPDGEMMADVPEKVRAQIREEAVLGIFNKLESSLRLLLYATEPGREPPSAEDFRQILAVWRYELQERVTLVPDSYCGAVERYRPEMDAAYSVLGRCTDGDLLRIKVPCWRLFGQVVVRGEAERLEGEVEPDSVPAATLPEPGAGLKDDLDSLYRTG